MAAYNKFPFCLYLCCMPYVFRRCLFTIVFLRMLACTHGVVKYIAAYPSRQNVIHSLLGPNGISPPLPGANHTSRFLDKIVLTPLVQPYFYVARGRMLVHIPCRTKSRTCSFVLLCMRVKGHKDKSQTFVRRQYRSHVNSHPPYRCTSRRIFPLLLNLPVKHPGCPAPPSPDHYSI